MHEIGEGPSLGIVELGGEEYQRARDRFRRFAKTEVLPHADRFDREERIPRTLIDRLAEEGYLGLGLPARVGGGGADMITYGLLHQELGRSSASVEGVLNVHNMAAWPILKWGSTPLREEWLPRLATGAALAAFAITEPEVGSDAKSVGTVARLDGDTYVLNGTKKWITCGQIADVFLVLARCDDVPTAFLVERGSPGFRTQAINGLLGCRGYMLAELHLNDCRIPQSHLVGRTGFGLTHVAALGLDIGRYGLAWGCAGLLGACLDASLRHADRRRQFGVRLREHQLVQQMLTRMIASERAARLLCLHAGRLRDRRDASAIAETSLAKYFASTALNRAATDAVQIHGAAGCSAEHPVQRYMRDAKIMELIEGSTQFQEMAIASFAYQGFDA
jgi:alkylation response protein AidB-like acyl-CoA dehydrogenase